MLEEEWIGLIEDSSAIAPPRDILVMLEGETDRELDYDFVRSSVRAEAFWDKTVVTDQQNGVSHFLWIDGVQGLSTIYVARSDDNGQTLSEGIAVSQSVEDAFNPILAIDSGGNLYAVWRTRHHIDIDIFFARSADGGQTWSNAVRINDDIRQAFNPSLAVDTQGRVYVAWQNHPGTVATDIYLSQSSDGGRTWSKERRMAN
jgi:Neuraminidase (sialidase)